MQETCITLKNNSIKCKKLESQSNTQLYFKTPVCGPIFSSFKMICGKNNSVDIEIITEWIEKLTEICNGYKPRNMLNADNTNNRTIFSCFTKQNYELQK